MEELISVNASLLSVPLLVWWGRVEANFPEGISEPIKHFNYKHIFTAHGVSLHALKIHQKGWEHGNDPGQKDAVPFSVSEKENGPLSRLQENFHGW
jgi:hypothetical protein